MDKLKAMSTFVAIVDQGSLSAAGDKLDRSPAAIVRTLAAAPAASPSPTKAATTCNTAARSSPTSTAPKRVWTAAAPNPPALSRSPRR